MKERPILFSAPMVRALLAGTKTQTRRVVKISGAPACGAFWDHRGYEPQYQPGQKNFRFHFLESGALAAHSPEIACPYGVPGDRFWVKETFRVNGTMAGPKITYRADDAKLWPKGCPDDCDDWIADDNNWRPSIFMRRYASRLTLEITDVRLQRLNEISETDAMNEGVVYDQRLEGYCTDSDGRNFHCTDPRISYRKLWTNINGDGSWEKNPWVWVIEFNRIP